MRAGIYALTAKIKKRASWSIGGLIPISLVNQSFMCPQKAPSFRMRILILKYSESGIISAKFASYSDVEGYPIVLAAI